MQNAKIIDITRSYVPVDPRTFPQTLHGTTQEDAPEDAKQVVPYEGYNFLPTSYGYKSYFGIAGALIDTQLTANVDEIITLQTIYFTNIMIALCDDGIWVKRGSVWAKEVALPVPTLGKHLDWTHCFLNGTLFCYRATEAQVHTIAFKDTFFATPVASASSGIDLTLCTFTYADEDTAPVRNVTFWLAKSFQEGVPLLSAATTVTGTQKNQIAVKVPNAYLPTTESKLTMYYTISTELGVYRKLTSVGTVFDANYKLALFDLPSGAVTTECNLVPAGTVYSRTPTFLNMAGQQGIFAAGLRLGFWDSANSVAWSSIDDEMEFTPSVQTLAGSAIFSKVQGRILRCLAQGDGFLIYATNSIVVVKPAVQQTFQWESERIMQQAGISYIQQAVASVPDIVHFAYTTIGIVKIEQGQLEFIIPEVYEVLKGADVPISLTLLQGRYLCFGTTEEDVLLGQVGFTSEIIPNTLTTLPTDEQAQTIINGMTLDGSDMCYNVHVMMDGGSTQETAAAAAAEQLKPPKDDAASPWYEPIWELTYKQGTGMSAITWVGSPCSNPLEMTPVPNLNGAYFGNEGSDLKTMDTTLWNLTGAQMLTVFGMILKEYAKNYDAYIDQVIQHTDESVPVVTTSGMKQTGVLDAGVFPSDTYYKWHKTGTWDSNFHNCPVGEYFTGWQGPYLHPGWCDMEVFMYATRRLTVESIIQDRNTVTVLDRRPPGYYNHQSFDNDPGTNSNVSAKAACQLFWPGSTYLDDPDADAFATGGSSGSAGCYNPDHSVAGTMYFNDTPWENRQSSFRTYGYNAVTADDYGVFGRIAIKLSLKGWKYKDAQGNTQIVNKPGWMANCGPTSDTKEDVPFSFPMKSDKAGTDEDTTGGMICGVPFQPITIADTVIPVVSWPTQQVLVPGTTFTLQDGSIGPIYPLYKGAYVYDLHLKKWGKLKQDYKLLVSFSAVNGERGELVDVDTAGIAGGILDANGYIRKFDENPVSSRLAYGKIGYYRLGNTNLEEARFMFRKPCSGKFKTEGSLNGQVAEMGLISTTVYDNITEMTVNRNVNGKWFNLVFEGEYDITHLEFRGVRAGRR